VYLHVLTKVGD